MSSHPLNRRTFLRSAAMAGAALPAVATAENHFRRTLNLDDPEDGVVRASMVQYNTHAEVDLLIKALDEAIALPTEDVGGERQQCIE